MAYDTVRAQTVLFGGAGGSWLGDMWTLRSDCTAPAIVTQPMNQSACPGGAATFTVHMSDDTDVSFAWRRDNRPLTDEPNHIAGSSTSTLTILNASGADEGSYTCVLMYAGGFVRSQSAALTVAPLLADLTDDGTVDITDLAILLSNFGRTDGPTHADGDLDANGVIDIADVALLLTGFGTSC